MPPQLTPELYAQLMQQYLASNYGLNESGFAPTAVVHAGEDAGNPSQLLGFTGNFSGLNPGSTYDLYGTGGDYAGQRKVENGGSVGDLLKSTISDNAEGAALLAALYGAGSLINGGFLGFGGAEGAIDPSLAVQGNSINALDAGSAGLAANGGVAVPYGSEAAAGGGSLLSGAAGAGTAAGTVAGTAGAAAGAGGLLSGAGSILGPAATLLGAAAGSQPQQTSQSTTRDIPEALKPYVYGQGGLLPSAQNLFQQQIANPQGWQQMSQTGLGLLSQPIAGNGYAQFAAMPRFGR
jgi:hypothetical protein